MVTSSKPQTNGYNLKHRIAPVQERLHSTTTSATPRCLSLSGFRHIHLILCLSAIASVLSHGPTSTWLKQSPVSSTHLTVKQSHQLLKHFQSCCQNLTSLPAGSRLARGECSSAALSLSAATFSAGKGLSTFYLLTNAFVVTSGYAFLCTLDHFCCQYGILIQFFYTTEVQKRLPNNNKQVLECHKKILALNDNVSPKVQLGVAWRLWIP